MSLINMEDFCNQIRLRKKISVLEIHVELHTSNAYLSLHSSLKYTMNTPSKVYNIHNSQCIRGYLVICMLTVLQC